MVKRVRDVLRKIKRSYESRITLQSVHDDNIRITNDLHTLYDTVLQLDTKLVSMKNEYDNTLGRIETIARNIETKIDLNSPDLSIIRDKLIGMKNEYDHTFGRIEATTRNIESKIDLNSDSIKRGIGRIENRQSGVNNIEFKVYSQWGEDGIIQHIVNNISISRKIFVEFGVENYTESNTRFLLTNNGWSGLVMDGTDSNIDYIKHDPIYWTYNVKAKAAFITKESINELLLDSGISGDIGLLSIDIDGNDYWVWKEINAINPDIVVCEYNPRFGKEDAVTIPYKSDFVRSNAHYSGIYFGASIAALVKLGREKGYTLVYGNEANLFFVKNELCNDIIKECTIDAAYKKNQYQDSRNEKGDIERISYEEEQRIIKSMPKVNV